ncbi:MAG: hypothetical protein KGJ59_04000 [Bacteroidota bacterium]|nr:hypothetical protein [Bacteroidota bacterium]
MFSATVLLKIAAGLAFIQYTAHTFLFLRAKPTHGEEEAKLINTMRAQQWDFNGFSRSYWDFYFGYGLLAILWGFIEVLFLWRLSALVPAPISVFFFLVLLIIANIGHAVLTLRYFFLMPAVFDLLIAAVLLITLLK